MVYLKLRWARFFTLAGWNWRLAHPRTGADFIVTLPCEHSECHGSHTLAVRICNKNREALENKHDQMYDPPLMYQEPHPALFGDGPRNTVWQMSHGAGGGTFSVLQWASERLWEVAARG